MQCLNCKIKVRDDQVVCRCGDRLTNRVAEPAPRKRAARRTPAVAVAGDGSAGGAWGRTVPPRG